jgi:serine/threonine protein kinase
MSFVKLSIFGTSFEVRLTKLLLKCPVFIFQQVTTRYVDLQPVGMGKLSNTQVVEFINFYLKVLLVLSGMHETSRDGVPGGRMQWLRVTNASCVCSSAKDQLTNTNVAIKKIMKPFGTPVLSKRTYRELKLLKHIQHENVFP